MKPINPTNVLFIKLGAGGQWENECIEKGLLKLGFNEADFDTCKKGEWDKINKYYIQVEKKVKSTASRFMGEIRHFFEEPDTTLWITYHDRKVWWAFVENKITLLPDKTKTRKIIDKWCSTDINGIPLTFDNISGILLKTQGYQSTICSVKADEYLINKINGISSKEIIATETQYKNLHTSIEVLIKRLTWHDFEILIDLIFRQAGWQRSGVVGKTEKGIDIDLISPVTYEQAYVQVKSQSGLPEFEKYLSDYKKMKQYQKFFFVVHTTKDKKLLEYQGNHEINLWNAKRIAELAIDAGLTKWIIKKSY